MRKFIIMLAVLLMPLGAFAGTATETGNAVSATDNALALGVRLGAGIFYVVTDDDADIYPSDGGLNGVLSFEVAYNLTGNLYLHSGFGLSYLTSFVYVEESSYCCVAPLDLENDNSAGSDEREVESRSYSSGGYWEYYQSLSLEIPLLVQWRIPGILFLEAGASADMIVWSKTHGGMGIVQSEGDGSVDIANSFGVNLIAGIGHKFDNGLFIDFRATFRLNDVVDSDKFIEHRVESWNSVEEDGSTFEGDSEDFSEPYGSYYKLLKFQLGVGYWF